MSSSSRTPTPEDTGRHSPSSSVSKSRPKSPSLAHLSFDKPFGSTSYLNGPYSHHRNGVETTHSPSRGVDPSRLQRPSMDAGDLYPTTAHSAGWKRPAEGTDYSPNSKKKRLSLPTSEGSGKDEADREKEKEKETAGAITGAKRAAQACLRCRRQKLRCLGGWPCDRCKKAGHVCDFDKPGEGSSAAPGSAVKTEGRSAGRAKKEAAGPSSGSAIEDALAVSGSRNGKPDARLQQLESSVANLLAGLAGGSPAAANAQYPQTEMLHQLGDRTDDERGFSLLSKYAQQASGAGASDTARRGRAPSWSHLPPPTHTRPREMPRFGGKQQMSTVLPVDSQGSDSIRTTNLGVRFLGSPNNILINGTSPSTVASTSGLTPDSAAHGRRRQEEPEERIKAATESLYEAPFKELLHPARGASRAASRAASPERIAQRYGGRFGWERDDPVSTGLVDLSMAQTLFQFFIDHCHPFFPIVNVALDDAFTTIRQSPPLISAMLSIAARFYVRYSKRPLPPSHPPLPPLDPSIPGKLANLAEMHLAQTLLRKQHALSDAQATLLLSAWGVHPGGKGSDSWILSGHAARLMRRLGVHKVLAQAAQAARTTEPETDEWDKLETFMPQWRTWLGWFASDGFLTLGFGRPQSTQFETVDESGFLQIRLNQTLPRPGSTASVGLYGDVYIAGWTQLTQIARDLFNWGEMLSDTEKAVFADLTRIEMFKGRDLSVGGMFRELNGRLDEWSRLWVWSGSPYATYLGSSARIARLQAEHMRLCLNSYALKAGPDEDELVGQCLKKALNAAMSTIQTHFESSQTDLALSFATDYLTITLAQAATFLIRITKSPESVQRLVGVDHSVVAHYLRMSVDLLESADLSETRLATFLARTIRDVSRTAGIAVFGAGEREKEKEKEKGRSGSGGNGGGGNGAVGIAGNGPGSVNTPAPVQTSEEPAGSFDPVDFDQFTHGHVPGPGGQDSHGAMDPAVNGGLDYNNILAGFNTDPNGLDPTDSANGGDDPFDLENYLQLEQQLDLGYLLGLPGDNGNAGNQGGLNYGTGGFEGEFGFGMGGMGVGVGGGGLGSLGGLGGFGGFGAGAGGGGGNGNANANGGGGSGGVGGIWGGIGDT